MGGVSILISVGVIQLAGLLTGQDMLKKLEQEMQVFKNNLKEEHDRKIFYADKNKMIKEFQVGEHVCFHIKTKKSSLRIGSCAKLEPRYYGPFKILERIGPIAYRLAMPLKVKVHDVFHMSLLKKYVKYVDHVIEWCMFQVEPKGELQLNSQCILQRNMLMLRNRAIKQVKVKWKHFEPDESMIRDGRSDAGYVSFSIHWLRECILVYVLVWCFGICTYIYGCKYCHELCYKSLISDMNVMQLCLLSCLCWFSFNRLIIVNNAMS